MFLKKLSFTVLLSCLLFISFHFFKIILQLDLSHEPIQQTAFIRAPLNKKEFAQQGVYLISYADGDEVFLRNQNILAHSALNKGIDFILNYRRDHLNTAFTEKNKFILNQKRGAGLWLWKPYIILKTLQTIPEGAILIYADVGFVIKKTITPLLKALGDKDILLFDDRVTPTANNPPLPAIPRIMQCKLKQCYEASPRIWASALIMKNNQRTRTFIRKWLSFCEIPHLIMGNYEKPKEIKYYDPPLHDQSILKILYQQYPQDIGLYPLHQFFDIFCWHHRHPIREHESILYYMNKGMSKWVKIILESKPAAYLRHFLYQKNKKSV